MLCHQRIESQAIHFRWTYQSYPQPHHQRLWQRNLQISQQFVFVAFSVFVNRESDIQNSVLDTNNNTQDRFRRWRRWWLRTKLQLNDQRYELRTMIYRRIYVWQCSRARENVVSYNTELIFSVQSKKLEKWWGLSLHPENKLRTIANYIFKAYILSNLLLKHFGCWGFLWIRIEIIKIVRSFPWLLRKEMEIFVVRDIPEATNTTKFCTFPYRKRDSSSC